MDRQRPLELIGPLFAADVANADLRVTYDPQIFYLLDVSKAPLTESFGLKYESEAGYVDIVMAASSALLSGDGPILYLSFYAWPTVALGTMTDLTIAQHGLGDQFGAELAWNSGISVVHGMLGIAMTNDLEVFTHQESDEVGVEWATRWWQSYRVELSTNLTAGFDPVESNLVGNGTIKSYLDIKSEDSSTKIYRVVQE